MLPRITALIAGVALLVGCGGPSAGQPTTAADQAASKAAATVQAAVAQVAPTAQSAAATAQVAAPTAQAVAPTVAAVATQVASAATAAAPTAQAAATLVVSTVAPAATAVAPAVGTAVAMSPVQIVDAKLGLPDTTLTVRNSGLAAIDMSGWGLRAGQATATLPANMRVAPGETITLHTMDGASTGKDVYLGTAATASLLTGMRPGNKVALLDRQGRVMTEFTLAA
jgi:hypothetical protein